MMKKITLSAIIAISSLFLLTGNSFAKTPAGQKNMDSLAVVGANWHWTDLGNGAQSGYIHMCLFDAPQYVSVVRYPKGKFSTEVLHAPGKECNSTDSLARRVNAKWAINGSYFDMGPIIPCTFFCIDGEIFASTSESELSRVNGMLVIPNKNGRRIKIEEYSPSVAEKTAAKNHAALASGPILRLGGKDADSSRPGGFTQGRHPRTIIAQDKYGYIYMMVVDGRSRGNSEGMSIPELVALCRYMGLSDALNLDGGGSSLIWTAQEGTLNHPSDNRKWDNKGGRRVPNIVYVK